MTARQLMLAAGLGSLILLAGAFGFQAAGYAPCKMCLWQRWPHAVAVAAGALALVWAGRPVALAGLAGTLTTAGLGVYHTGVERRWWQGPTSCTGDGDLSGLTGGDLLSIEAPGGLVMCDQVTWAFAGLSMASWNAVFSLTLAALWAGALIRLVRPA